MGHHGQRDVIKKALFDQFHLAARGLFCRSSEDLDRQAQLIGHGRQRQGRTHSAGRIDVVPAGVTDRWQSVILHAEGHHEVAASAARTERGWLQRLAPVETEIGRLQKAPDPLDGTKFLAAKLRIRVDSVTQVQHGRFPPLQGRFQHAFDVASGDGCDRGPEAAAVGPPRDESANPALVRASLAILLTLHRVPLPTSTEHRRVRLVQQVSLPRWARQLVPGGCPAVATPVRHHGHGEERLG